MPFHFLLQSATCLLAPAPCHVCGLPLLRATRYPVCDGCLGGLHTSPFAGCSRCGEALGMDAERGAGFSRAHEVLCDACHTEPPEFARATAFGDYGGALRVLIHLHKFEGVRALAKPLGDRLAVAMERACADVTGPLHVVAVPLYRRKRPFNQSALLADAAMQAMRRTRPDLLLKRAHGLLRRTRPTESQTHLTPRQRQVNVRGAFEVVGDVRGLQVVLVDDVYTTGATAAECTRVLLRAGAAQVRVVTLARTQQRLAAVWDAAPEARADEAALVGRWTEI